MADDETTTTHDGFAETPEAAVHQMTGGTSEPYRTVPTTTLDLAYRQAQERGEVPAEVGAPRSFAVEGNEESLQNYVGVSPEYQGFGDPTQAPMRSEEGPEAEAERRAYEAQAESGQTTAVPQPAAPEEAPRGRGRRGTHSAED